MLLVPRLPLLDTGVTMACTMRALAVHEWRTGRPLGSAPGLAGIRSMLWALVENQDIPEDEIFDVIEPRELPGVLRDVEGLCLGSMPLPEIGIAPRAPELRDWHALWSAGRLHFGLEESEFWKMTPLMFQALADRYEEQCDRQYEGSALVAAMLYNANRGEKDVALDPEYFMRGKRGVEARAKLEAAKAEGLRAKFADLKRMLPGRYVAPRPELVRNDGR